MFSLRKFIPDREIKIIEPLISSDYPEGTVIRVRKKDGIRFWYLDGLLHRDPAKGPAVENPDGTGVCYTMGKPHGEVWVDELVPSEEAPAPAVAVAAVVKKPAPSPVKPKREGRIRMSFVEFKLQQARNKAAENLHDDLEEEPGAADLSRLFRVQSFRPKSKHRR